VKLTIRLKLKPTKEQLEDLRETLERANAAANAASQIAWNGQVFSQFNLHKLAYQSLRERFGLSAQLAVRVIAKVAHAYQLDTKKQRTFYKHGSVPFDDRILRYGADYVSIRTIKSRTKIPFVCGPREAQLLAIREGESDLVYRNGHWYLHATVRLAKHLPTIRKTIWESTLGLRASPLTVMGNLSPVPRRAI
jgi:putative transposase